MADSDATPVVISRKEAKAAGLKRYFTGEPCKRGHTAERLVSNFGCFVCAAAKQRALHVAAPEVRKARFAKWYALNVKEFQAGKAADRRANPEKFAARFKKWAEANPERIGANIRTRAARIRGAEGRHTGAEIKALFKLQRGKCAYCGTSIKAGYHVDHIVPIAKGGSNWIANLQLTCSQCNHRKWAKDPIVWARETGRLL